MDSCWKINLNHSKPLEPEWQLCDRCHLIGNLSGILICGFDEDGSPMPEGNRSHLLLKISSKRILSPALKKEQDDEAHDLLRADHFSERQTTSLRPNHPASAVAGLFTRRKSSFLGCRF